MSVSSHFLSLTSCVPSIFSQSIVPLLQQAACFSVACCRGSERSAVWSSTKGYKSATFIWVRQQLQGHGKTADESVCDYQKMSKLPRLEPFSPILQEKLSAVWKCWDFRMPTAGCKHQEITQSHWSHFLQNISLSGASLMCHRMPSEKSAWFLLKWHWRYRWFFGQWIPVTFPIIYGKGFKKYIYGKKSVTVFRTTFLNVDSCTLKW